MPKSPVVVPDTMTDRSNSVGRNLHININTNKLLCKEKKAFLIEFSLCILHDSTVHLPLLLSPSTIIKEHVAVKVH